MKKLILLLVFVGIAVGQQPSPVTTIAKCIIPFTINSTSTTSPTGKFQPSATGYDNRQTGCTNWSLVYTSTGYTVISLRFESAPTLSNTPPGTPDTYVAYSESIVTGINPNTATTSAASTFSGYTPWIRLAANTLTGTGRIVGVLIGTLPISATGGGAGTGTPCPGTVATPCVVVGPVADGVAVAGAPVRIAGKDAGGLTQDLKSDAFGAQMPSSLALAQADAQSNNIQVLRSSDEANGALGTPFNRVYPFMFNGATWDRQFICPNRASVTLADGTLTALVAVSGSTVIRVCHIHMTTTAAETFSILQGTGVACAGAAATIDKYINTVALAIDFQPTAALRTSASNGLCVQQSGTQAAEITVIYAQY